MTLKANVPNRIDILIPGQFGSLFRRCFDAFELLPVPVTCWRRARIWLHERIASGNIRLSTINAAKADVAVSACRSGGCCVDHLNLHNQQWSQTSV